MCFFTVHNSVTDSQCDNFARAPKNLAMSLHKLQNFAHTSGTWKTQTAHLSVSRQGQQRPSISSLFFQFKKGSRFWGADIRRMSAPQQAAEPLKFPRNDCSLRGTELKNEVGFILKCDLNWLPNCKNWSNIAIWQSPCRYKNGLRQMLKLLSVEW